MARLGLTNIYLKCGLLLILFGLVCGIVVFNTQFADTHDRDRLLWFAMSSFSAGLVLYVIGRIKHAFRHFGHPGPRS